MDINDANKWLVFVSNLAVVAGIILLAYEIQQNNEQLRTQIAISQHQIRVNDVGRFATDSELASAKLKMERGEELTDIEREKLSAAWSTRFLNWELEYGLGMRTTRARRAAFRNNPGAEEFWNEYEPFLRPDFVEWANREILADYSKPESDD